MFSERQLFVFETDLFHDFKFKVNEYAFEIREFYLTRTDKRKLFFLSNRILLFFITCFSGTCHVYVFFK